MADLDYLRSLRAGWYGPGSLPIAPLPIANYEAFRGAVNSADCPEPLGASDGSIHMEWDNGARSYIAELQPDGSMFLVTLCPDDADDREQESAFDLEALLMFYRGTDG